MKTKRKNTASFWIKIFLAVFLSVTLTADKSSAQVFEIKSWTGSYPDMNNSYPLVFIAYKGGIIGIPHVFVRYWPTHNYKDLIAKSVVDPTEASSRLKNDLAKSLLKMIEQKLMEGRFIETGLIKVNTRQQKEIVQKIFEARFDQLGDIWELTELFLHVYHKIDRFSGTSANSAIKNLLKKEANELFMRFLLVNLLESEHGQKVESFGDLKVEITHLLGEVDYTFKKLQFFESFGESIQVSYSFLTQ